MGTSGMSYSLQSRDLIADQVETAAGGHWLDGMVVVPGCDKNMPGVLMARKFPLCLWAHAVTYVGNSGPTEPSWSHGIRWHHPSWVVRRRTPTRHRFCIPVVRQVPSGWQDTCGGERTVRHCQTRLPWARRLWRGTRFRPSQSHSPRLYSRRAIS